MIETLLHFQGRVAAVLAVLIPALASAHVLLHKRDPRSAIGWIGLLWLVPVLGAVFYLLFGINRIRRRAASLRPGADRLALAGPHGFECEQGLIEALGEGGAHLCAIANVVNRVSRRPLTAGNRVSSLRGGDEAYPRMLKAIDAAERSVCLSSYIFARDEAGAPFVEALIRAKGRGVEVRVLVDDVGANYYWRQVRRELHRGGVAAAHFIPTLLPWRLPYMNLRNHRKILVADGRLGFTGGMNIHVGHLLGAEPPYPVQDAHFEVEGPAVRHLSQVFAEDWYFSTRQILRGEAWFPKLEPAGSVFARGVSDGPDEDFDALRWTLNGAIEAAARRIRIVTPYFLPDDPLSTALSVSAMTGIEVDIVLPSRNNLRLVQWASQPGLRRLLRRGCRIWLSPPPFDHSKLMTVDGNWSLVGSANWDPRSLRLNFELCMECYDAALAGRLDAMIDERIEASTRLTIDELDGRPLAVKLRDGAARLLTPYL